jgi:hypothetical protein
MSYDKYFSATRKFSDSQISQTRSWTGPDGGTYTLQSMGAQGLCVINESQQILWTVPGTETSDSIQWLVCDGQWAYGITATDILRIEL